MAGIHASMAAARVLAQMQQDKASGNDHSILNNINPFEVALLGDLSTPSTGTVPPRSPIRSPTSPSLSPHHTPSGSPEQSAVYVESENTEKVVSQNPSDAAKQGLALNIRIQVSLREELTRVNEVLAENREALNMALARFCSRSPAMATTSNKFVWARAVEKFLECRAHPAIVPSRKEQETLLRTDPQLWPPFQAKALREIMTNLYPATVNSATAVDALDTVDWAAVASSIGGINNGCKAPSRSKRVPTAEECRARWTHFEMPGVVSLHETWTKEEDISIIEQVGIYGDRAWVKIADEVAKATGRQVGAGRTPIACFKRFQAALSQGLVSLSRWSETEDAILRQAVERFGCKEWLSVSRALPNRTPGQCLNRWTHMKTSCSTFVKKSREMSLLLQDTDDDADADADSNPEDQHGPKIDSANASFQSVTKEHEGRGGDSLGCGGDDPLESVEPDGNSRLVFLRGGPWTATEERRLCLAVRAISTSENPDEDDQQRKEQGRSRLENGKTSTGVCSHDCPSQTGLKFPKKISRKRARSEENQKLDWGGVSWLMKGTRSDQQCRKKWVECIDTSVKRGAWDEAEDAELLRCVEARTAGEWAAIERDMYRWAQKHNTTRRTDQQCRRRFGHLRPEEWERHVQFEKDRRAVEPARRSGRVFAFNSKTNVTIEDYDVHSESDED